LELCPIGQCAEPILVKVKEAASSSISRSTPTPAHHLPTQEEVDVGNGDKYLVVGARLKKNGFHYSTKGRKAKNKAHMTWLANIPVVKGAVIPRSREVSKFFREKLTRQISIKLLLDTSTA